ncbi:glycosyltransferase family 87 protein [Luteococcus sp.]|uniref:glycosyltransferase family 87 protein n=1 Tax=Luteococcus sp. TaxID=1969402 RepID=UPI003735A596
MDFRDTLWLPTKDLLAGNMPWDIAAYKDRYPGAQIVPVYTPWYGIVTYPLTLLPYELACAIWLALSTAALCCMVTMSLARLWPAALAKAPWALPVVMTVLCLSRPGRSGITSGNWAVLTASGAALALLLPPERRHQTVAALLAFVKPQVAVPFVATQLIRGEAKSLWRPLGLGALLSLPVVILACQRAGGPSRALGYVVSTLQAGDEVNTGPTSPSSTRVDLAGNLERLGADAALTIVGLMASVALLLVLALLATRRFGPLSYQSLLACGLAMLVILPNQSYGYPVLIPGLVAAVGALSTDSSLSTRDRLVLLLTLTLLAVPIADTGPAMGWLGLGKLSAAAVTASSLEASALGIFWLTMKSRPGEVSHPVQ